MILPSDKEYKSTKQIMLGNAEMPIEFRELADFIDTTFGVRTINIVYDTIEEFKPRLGIYFEFDYEKKLFYDIDHNYDVEKQNQIAARFGQSLNGQYVRRNKFFEFLGISKQKRYDCNNIWIYFSAFKPVAIIEAYGKISRKQTKSLMQDIASDELWEVSSGFSTVTFLLYTEEQVKLYMDSPERKRWADMFFELLEPHDEFNYFQRDKFNILLDSKENFDENFDGNWYYYYK